MGYIEAKDIGVDLNSKTLKEQFERYKAGLNILIITDNLHFKFYREGDFVTEISIGNFEDGQIKPLHENFEHTCAGIMIFHIFINAFKEDEIVWKFDDCIIFEKTSNSGWASLVLPVIDPSSQNWPHFLLDLFSKSSAYQ